MSYSRDSFYNYKQLYDEKGDAGLREASRRTPILKNLFAADVEEAVIALSIENPALGQVQGSNQLKQQGIYVSPGGVRSIWSRHESVLFWSRHAARSQS